MTGNVWEWTSSGYGDYPWSVQDSPAQVYRGGSWSRRFEKWMRVRLRNREPPTISRSASWAFGAREASPTRPCPFGRAADGACSVGVLDADCKPGKSWNGIRCAAPGEPECPDGFRPEPGEGCVLATKTDEPATAALDLAERAPPGARPEFDGDCQRFQSKRPHAFRFEGASHEARNVVEKSTGCKNRDVGVGWNSACCP